PARPFRGVRDRADGPHARGAGPDRRCRATPSGPPRTAAAQSRGLVARARPARRRGRGGDGRRPGSRAGVARQRAISPGTDRSERVFAAVAAAGVRALVYSSSVGAYSPGPKDHAVDESWPTDGIATSFYARHKAAVERSLDRLERDQPALRVVRLRPGLVFKRE